MNLLELARTLDIVDTIKLDAGTLTNSKQNVEYLIVIDFESTCWEKEEGKWRQPEIIGNKELYSAISYYQRHSLIYFFRYNTEFPAILVELKTQKILSEFRQYIMPIESPKLSEFCINLTGITQEKLDHGSVPLQTGLMYFSKWLNESIDKHKLVLPKVRDKHSNGTTAFVTWSDWDFGICLTKECERKRIKKPQCFDRWIDLKATFKVTYWASY